MTKEQDQIAAPRTKPVLERWQALRVADGPVDPQP